MFILQNDIFAEYWYFFILFLGIGISVVYYVNNKKKSYRKSLFLLFGLVIFSVSIHNLQDHGFENGLNLTGINAIEDDHFGTSPDYLGKAVERLYDFIRRKFF